jgi:dihydrofolate synthase/folylpolyglutamate synthase
MNNLDEIKEFKNTENIELENIDILDNFLNKFTQTTDFPTLDAMLFLMDKLDNPEKNLKFVHVAGTNGKGSIVEMLNSCIIASNSYTVGKFISPHLISSTECVQINNVPISTNSILKYIPLFENLENEYFAKTSRHLTRFEVLTSIAILYFFENNCDIVILEVGLGGLYDCTNIVEPIVSAFGSISLDHMAILGNTIEEIAVQKAGIIKKNSNTVIFEQKALPVIEEKCKTENNHLTVVYPKDISNYTVDTFSRNNFSKEKDNIDSIAIKNNIQNLNTNNFNDNLYQHFTYKNKDYSINLKGKKQIENACVVLEIIEILNKNGFVLKDDFAKFGLKNVTHHARFEIINKNPIVIYDGAHNEGAMKNLIESIKTYYPNNKKKFIISIIQTKDYKTLLNMLVSAFDNCTFIFTSGSNGNHKFWSNDTLYEYAKSITTTYQKKNNKENKFETETDNNNNNILIDESNFETAIKSILQSNNSNIKSKNNSIENNINIDNNNTKKEFIYKNEFIDNDEITFVIGSFYNYKSTVQFFDKLK